MPDVPEVFQIDIAGPGGFSDTAFLVDDGSVVSDLLGSDRRRFGSLATGTYTISELVPSGFSASIACVDESGAPVGDGNADPEAAEVSLGGGDDLTCTVTNTLVSPRITVVKDTRGVGEGDGQRLPVGADGTDSPGVGVEAGDGGPGAVEEAEAVVVAGGEDLVTDGEVPLPDHQVLTELAGVAKAPAGSVVEVVDVDVSGGDHEAAAPGLAGRPPVGDEPFPDVLGRVGVVDAVVGMVGVLGHDAQPGGGLHGDPGQAHRVGRDRTRRGISAIASAAAPEKGASP